MNQQDKNNLVILLKRYGVKDAEKNINILYDFSKKRVLDCINNNSHKSDTCNCVKNGLKELREAILKIKHDQDFNVKLNDILNSD